MSDKTWADEITAESALPSDDFTWTEGSNYGLDGFYFDQTMGEGVKQHARLPEARGISGLPEGILADPKKTAYDDISLVDTEEGVNLGVFIDETAIERTASLADLGWLDPTSPQNPDRLPHSPVDRVQMELEDAWGVDRRTTGLNLIPNQDREAAEYKLSLGEGPKSGLPQDKEARAEIKRMGHWALRQSAIGRSVQEIKRSLVARLGEHARALRGLVARIEEEHGLAGNVYVYAAAYPGIHRAKTAQQWKQHLKGMKARYVIVPKGEERLAAWEAIGKIPVTSVPWRKARAYYEPQLAAAGYKVASGDPREALRRAFLAGPSSPDPELGTRPRDIRPSERVSVQEAVSKFRTAEAVPRQVVSTGDREAKARRKKALVQIAKWVKAGHLTVEDAHRLARSTVAPRMILRTASMLVQASVTPEAGSYKGTGTHYKAKVASVSKEAAWRHLEAAEAEADRKARDFEASQKGKVASELEEMVSRGLLTEDESKRLMSSGKTAAEIRKLAAAAARQDYLRPKVLPQVKEREYEGAIVTATVLKQGRDSKDRSPEETRIRKASKKSGIKSSEFRSLLKWARIQMSEGAAGDELDSLLKLRFSKPLRKAARGMLKDLRATHEGLAGFLYVDAAAYASPKGVAGCEKGARRHRANQLKFVLAMDRCGSCTFKNDNGACTKYAKDLVESPPVEDVKEYKRAAIRSANAADYETTGSLFAPSYDQGEYSLTDPLQEISLDEAAGVEDLGDVLFGGMEL